MFHDPSFWVTISGLLFALLVYSPLARLIKNFLDKRIENIKSEIDGANDLCEEAEKLVAEYQKNQKRARADYENLVAKAKEQAVEYVKSEQQKLRDSLEIRRRVSDETIENMKRQNEYRLRRRIVELVIFGATSFMEQQSDDGVNSDHDIDNLINNLN